jgi:RHS repeat-associated protein
LTSITYANGTGQQYSYNPLGEATQFVNANGQAIGYTYNNQGLVATETFADGTSYSYTYDGYGNLTSAKDAQGNVTTFVYGNPTNPDLLTEVEYPDGTWLKFSYNALGQRVQSLDQTGFTVNYTYDSLGRLSELTDGSGNLIVLYTYDAAGNLVQKDDGNGTRTVYTYDGDGDVLSITNYASPNGQINSFDDYTYDALGNVLTDTNQDGEWVYTYDADSQLIGAVFTPNSIDPDGLTPQNLQYVYDAAGNRESETVNGVTTTYVVNNVSEYTSSTTNGVITNFQYDADGNLTAQTTGSSTTSYTFNELSQLTAVNGPGVVASYGYDPLGNLVSQTVNGATTNFQVDPASLGNVVATYALAGGAVTHYTYGLGLVSQVNPIGVAAYYDFNNIGSTVGITNAAGKVVNSYAYGPFGNSLAKSETVLNPFGFVGEFGVMNEGNGLDFMRARYYDSETGRFVQADPTGLLGGPNVNT